MSKEKRKLFFERLAIASLGVFLYLTGCGILDTQDEKITQKNRAVLSVLASNDRIKLDLCFAENRDYLNADLNHFCRGLNEKS